MSDQREHWRSEYEGAKKRDVDFETLSGEPIQPLYEQSDLEGSDPEAKLGTPGHFPFTRGIYTTGYRGRLWTLRQFAGFGDVAATNERYHQLLAQGQTGLSVAFDMPTLMGRDSDEPLSEGEVGHCGVAVDSAADMDRLFEGIPLGDITTSMTISGPAVILYAMFLVAGERQGYTPAQLGGTLQTDIFKEYIAQKEWLFPPEPHLRLIGDLLEFCVRETPRYYPISVSGYHIREAGSTAAQELAFTLADGFAYVELGQQRGIEPNLLAPKLSFFFDAHIDFFEEICKFRAARRIWARWMRDRYGADDVRAQMLKFHTQTAGVSLTAQQPYNNVVRTAIEALAAVLGGTQSLHTNALDEVLALPSAEAAEIALRTQQVIAHETGVTNTIDPLGGSYFIESLTDQLEERAEEIFAKIEELGGGKGMLAGVLAGIDRNWFISEIADAAYRDQVRIEQGRRTIVGVNAYTSDEKELEILRISPEVERRQKELLEQRRQARDGRAVEESLARLMAAARTDENLVPLIVEACRHEATVGEICGALKEVFGEYREAASF
ncbi:MAG: methylmalonyl-CoA mutase [Actinomycetota bacterium]